MGDDFDKANNEEGLKALNREMGPAGRCMRADARSREHLALPAVRSAG
jgi:hypothetical protein